jgi:hypothetical protein
MTGRDRRMLFCVMSSIQRHTGTPSLPSPSLQMTLIGIGATPVMGDALRKLSPACLAKLAREPTDPKGRQVIADLAVSPAQPLVALIWCAHAMTPDGSRSRCSPNMVPCHNPQPVGVCLRGRPPNRSFGIRTSWRFDTSIRSDGATVMLIGRCHARSPMVVDGALKSIMARLASRLV